MSVESVLRDKPSASGFALIISNDYVGSSALRELRGTSEDAVAMQHAFTCLNFAVLWKRNVTRGEMMSVIYEASRSKSYPPTCLSIAFVFSGHGSGSKRLYTQDEKTIEIMDAIISPFFPRNASHIGYIPKLFFIDACRGHERVKPVLVPVPKGVVKDIQTRGASNVSRFLAAESNYLVAYSTMPNHEAFEVEGKGGMWMTILAKKLRTSRGSIEDVLTEVNEELLEKYQQGGLTDIMQQPEKHSTLNKKVFLNPSLGFCTGHRIGVSTNEEEEEEEEKEEEEEEEEEKDEEDRLVPRDFSLSATQIPHHTKSMSMESAGSSCSLDQESDSPVVHRAKKRTGQSRGRRSRCGQCVGCKRTDCGKCINCKDRPKFGGSGRRKKACIHRKCYALGYQHSQDGSNGGSKINVIPGTSQKEQLEKYSLLSGRGKPVYSRKSTPGGQFVSTIRTSDFSHISEGDPMESIAKAEESAAAKLLEKLRIQ